MNSQTLACLDCGAILPDGQVHCPNCGKRAGDERNNDDRRAGFDRRQEQVPVAVDRRLRDRRTGRDRRQFAF